MQKFWTLNLTKRWKYLVIKSDDWGITWKHRYRAILFLICSINNGVSLNVLPMLYLKQKPP